MKGVLLLLAMGILCGHPGCGGVAATDGTGALDDPAAQDPVAGDDPGTSEPACPGLQDTFREMTPATFAVVVQYRRGPEPTNLVNVTLGTAFAIGPRQLATNAHVARAILDNALPVENIVAVQAGTGDFVRIVTVVVHPMYNGDPLSSPDVAILNTNIELLAHLELSSIEDVATIMPGDALALTGFPGDANELFTIIPGETVPQPTSLSGTITALRAFNPAVVVTAQTIDLVQHQLPTTPGTSGAALVRCGRVVALNNAGTVKVIITIDEDGVLRADRQPAAANNFGIHVRHLRELQGLVSVGLVAPEILPPPDPSFAGSYECTAYFALTGAFSHEFFLSINVSRLVQGTSKWTNVWLELDGTIDRFGNVRFSDNGPDQGLPPIRYSGFASGKTDEIVGVFFEGETRLGMWRCEGE